ncbi:TadE/TadG family type IV pilus assembly protein [Rhizobium binxianense]
MAAIDQKTDAVGPLASSRRPGLRAFIRSRDGTAAIEFALLAIPYFAVIFAILETFIAFAAEQLVSNAVDTMSRRMRTGQITYGLGRTTDMNEQQFRTAFCDEISILIRCSETEAGTPSKLYIDVRSANALSGISMTIPKVSTDEYADIDPSKFQFAPGGAGTFNMVRAYYRWEITADLIRPYITTIRTEGETMPSQYLIVATSVFQNEQYP